MDEWKEVGRGEGGVDEWKEVGGGEGGGVDEWKDVGGGVEQWKEVGNTWGEGSLENGDKGRYWVRGGVCCSDAAKHAWVSSPWLR